MWADGVPNLLIGLREGLEGGLVVSILLAALRRTDAKASPVPIWLGVLAATLLAISFGAVLTFSRSELSTAAQEAFGGTLSLIAVCLVTAMVFWMRRTARGLSGELSAKVSGAARVGAGALALTAFLAVGREGLETALFLWTTVQAAGESTAPLAGATVGIVIAALLCWLLYRSAIKINLGKFFSRTAVLLIVIAAGVLAYGLGELQGAGLLPGRTWLAFDLTATISPDEWWVTVVRGVTNLAPSMTWLQIVAYVTYLAAVMILFFRKPAAEPAPAAAAKPQAVPGKWLRRRWVAVTAAVAVPLLAAGVFALVVPASQAGAGAKQVTITASDCAPDFDALQAGQQQFTVVNKSGRVGEIYLIRPSDGGVIGEIEGIGPGTQRTMGVNLPAGDYAWRCEMSGTPEQLSATVAATGTGGVAPAAVLPVSAQDLDAPVHQYRDYVATQLSTLATQVDTLRAALAGNDLNAAKAAWLPAQLTWERVGAAYGSFGEFEAAIGGRPNGLPGGVDDPDFTGLRRIEYGLWHDQSAAMLTPVVDQLAQNVNQLREKLPTITADPADLPVRAHEILEDSLRDKLAGNDQGAGTGYQETLADVEGTRVVLAQLAPLVEARRPQLVATAQAQLDTLEQALRATTASPGTAPLAERQRVNAAIGQALETLSIIPNLLEIRQG
ncbi:iron uptake transporter permease EfeU [Amycolatopsis taiwanensis]|uniref:Iron permease FTR1 n=1 Tax=Amycolatopsis taiwanensis TaxID=342230 RepID=A0A9W6R4G5_9PSEU|nr:iron uptake transporter permease EfeU [Amycolatopsis taiwanensis]GLY67315.1 putative iron permease FTR1 [Amycolatopsis taiwanensis]